MYVYIPGLAHNLTGQRRLRLRTRSRAPAPRGLRVRQYCENLPPCRCCSAPAPGTLRIYEPSRQSLKSPLLPLYDLPARLYLTPFSLSALYTFLLASFKSARFLSACDKIFISPRATGFSLESMRTTLPLPGLGLNCERAKVWERETFARSRWLLSSLCLSCLIFIGLINVCGMKIKFLVGALVQYGGKNVGRC